MIEGMTAISMSGLLFSQLMNFCAPATPSLLLPHRKRLRDLLGVKRQTRAAPLPTLKRSASHECSQEPQELWVANPRTKPLPAACRKRGRGWVTKRWGLLQLGLPYAAMPGSRLVAAKVVRGACGRPLGLDKQILGMPMPRASSELRSERPQRPCCRRARRAAASHPGSGSESEEMGNRNPGPVQIKNDKEARLWRQEESPGHGDLTGSET